MKLLIKELKHLPLSLLKEGSKVSYLLGFLFFFHSCVKDIPNHVIKTIQNASHKGLVILNEGSYANNNAEISFLDYENNTISNSIFNTANNKSLGDVAQDIILVNGNYYITINNSNTIMVINSTSS
jgi:hypothetical protein